MQHLSLLRMINRSHNASLPHFEREKRINDLRSYSTYSLRKVWIISPYITEMSKKGKGSSANVLRRSNKAPTRLEDQGLWHISGQFKRTTFLYSLRKPVVNCRGIKVLEWNIRISCHPQIKFACLSSLLRSSDHLNITLLTAMSKSVFQNEQTVTQIVWMPLVSAVTNVLGLWSVGLHLKTWNPLNICLLFIYRILLGSVCRWRYSWNCYRKRLENKWGWPERGSLWQFILLVCCCLQEWWV